MYAGIVNINGEDERLRFFFHYPILLVGTGWDILKLKSTIFYFVQPDNMYIKISNTQMKNITMNIINNSFPPKYE